MNIDGVPTYADRIHEMCRTRPRLMLGRHLLFRDCLDGTDSPAFPNIRMLRQSALLPIMSGPTSARARRRACCRLALGSVASIDIRGSLAWHLVGSPQPWPPTGR